ncbi:MAG: hypothetical protein M3Z00_00605 [Actinomycetota bacterium]|nr:hypothetical protein [Actinomycetota bacterium]
MDRRFVGIGLVVAALLAAAILPGLTGRSSVGTPMAAHDVPVIGGCVLAPDGVQPTAVDLRKGTLRMQPARVAACDIAGAARVLDVKFGRSLPAGENPYAWWSHSCDQALVVAEGGSGASSYTWWGATTFAVLKPVFRLQSEMVGPVPGATSAGWSSCVAADYDGSAVALDLTQSSSWSELTYCVAAGDLQRYVGDPTYDIGNGASTCAQPHVAQVLGEQGQGGGVLKQAEYAAACLAFAQRATGMADPTAGGQLVVRPSGAADWAHGSGRCLVVAADHNRTLSGSLYGIGAAPLPWGN